MILAIQIKMNQSIVVLDLRSLCILFNNCSQIKNDRSNNIKVDYLVYTIVCTIVFCTVDFAQYRRHGSSLQTLICQPSFPATAGVRLCFITTSFIDKQVTQILLFFNKRACNVSDNSNSKVLHVSIF